MDKLIPTYTDISNWNVNVYQSTGGTRSKIITTPLNTNTEYFFKGSKVTELDEIKYPLEFWSEIISSKVGQLLGFKMLDYNIAYRESEFQKIGCLSASMVEHSQNKLTEGVTYLTGFKPSYRPSLKEHQKQYTFQFICAALNKFGLEKHIDNIIEIIIFDSIIGNSDRHQENWGIITYFKDAILNIDVILEKEKLVFKDRVMFKLVKFLVKALSNYHGASKLIEKITLELQKDIAPHGFAPIYDSGCCFGRELEPERVSKMLDDKQMLEAYVNKGESEIHWEGNPKKLKHFDLLKLVKQDYDKLVTKRIAEVKSNIDLKKIEKLIQQIDINLPEQLKDYKLPDDRKELIVKILTLRLEKLQTI